MSGCCPRLCVASHVACSVLYICAGAVQLIAGIFFLISLPVFKIGSNLWTGGWNVVVGVGGAVFSCVGDVTHTKHQVLLYLTISVTVVNIVNLLVLELGEWRLLMPDTIKRLIQQKHLMTLVFYARTTTSISTVVAAITSFIDAQFMFWWLERCVPTRVPMHHNETISDIEYIIPRAKSGSMNKSNSHNALNQYAQSWVFDADTVGSSQSDSPYNKLPPTFNGSKTVVLKRKQRPPTEQVAQPVVLVEDTTNGDRQLPFMTSFSRTPSPVPDGDSSSQGSESATAPAIYECLERLTEPSVYRARLNTALGTEVDRSSANVSPRPHSVVLNDQVHYASLMVELNKTIETKFPPKSPQGSTRHSRRPSARDDQKSDAEFSKELEAALQLIHDLESPSASEAPAKRYDDDTLGKRCVIHSEGNKTIISLAPQKKYTSIVNITSDREETKDSTGTKELDSSTHRSDTIDSRIIIGDERLPEKTPPMNKRPRPVLTKHKSFKDYSAFEFNNNTVRVDKVPKSVIGRSLSLTEKDSSPSRWSLKTLLKRKPSQLKLTPELESAILKSESLAHLTEPELIARYNRNKLLQRQIEEKAWQKITGNPLTDSSC